MNEAQYVSRYDALLYIDLDCFKHINDTHGHLAGDEALCAVSEVLASTVRERDIVARLGGDEFAVFAVDVPQEDGAQALASRLLEALDAHDAAATAKGRPYTIGFSIGAASVSRAQYV